MRTVSISRLAILVALLAATSLLIHLPGEKVAARSSKEPLQDGLKSIGGWRPIGNTPMDFRVVEELKLDDYLFQSYGSGTGLVNLYIGYYRTAKKVGAAHDPLVCFQGQGWQLFNRDRGEYSLSRKPDLKISYSTMIAQRQEHREMIVYWFQANGKAEASTQSQKVAILLDKLSGRYEENAFVRISSPIAGESPEAVRKRLFEFIEEFYPLFHRYVTNS